MISATMQAWFQGGPSSIQKDSQPVSLLEDWKNYEAQSQGQGIPPPTPAFDVEAGLGTAFAPTFFSGASTTVAGAWSTVSKTAQDLPGSIQRGATSLPSNKAVFYFGVTLASGLFFVMLAFTMFLPVMVLAPQKFALCFTIGCLLVMASFFVLKGPAAQFRHMATIERLPFTIFFVGSMAATIYVSMGLHSYILSVICSGLQVLSLLYYVVSYFPGGAAGMRFLTSMGTSAFFSFVGR